MLVTYTGSAAQIKYFTVVNSVVCHCVIAYIGSPIIQCGIPYFRASGTAPYREQHALYIPIVVAGSSYCVLLFALENSYNAKLKQLAL